MSSNQRNDKKSQLNKKKTRLYNSRNIKAQNSDPSYDQKDTKLNVPEFLESRKYEINAFELSQLKSKQALNSRCFQNLPRSMRRRAASHHISRIPKRLRSKALREMKGANTPSRKIAKGRKIYKLLQRQKLLKVASKMKKERYTPSDILKTFNVRAHYKEISKQLDKEWSPSGKKLNNSVGSFDHTGNYGVAKPPPRTIKYGARQQKFAWTPTHVWHAKRFKMSKKLDFQVPYTPTQKCFKSMNRQNRYKAVCFDTSYRGSLVFSCRDNEIIAVILKNILGTGPVPSSILNGKKSYTGLIHLPFLLDHVPVGFGTVYVSVGAKKIFLQIQTDNYKELVEKLSGIPYVNVKELLDCRYSLGSIDLSGPSSLEYLSRVLHLRDTPDKIKSTWASLCSHSYSSLIPIGTTLTLECYDPRLWNKPTKFPIKTDQDIYDTVIQLNNESLVDPATLEALFSADGRIKSYENQLSIKDLGKIRSHGTPFEKVSHSKIPILLTKTASQKWSLICPWFWVLPIWIQLVKIPDIKAGGLKQMYQFNFESNKLTYPYDYPWTDEGQKYNCMIGDLSREIEARKPKKLMSLQRAEDRFSNLYDAYTCDWHNLRCAMYALETMESNQISFVSTGLYSSPPSTFETELGNIVFANKKQDKHKSVVCVASASIVKQSNQPIDARDGVLYDKIPVVQISLKVVGEGVIENNARIYEKNVCRDKHVVGFVTTGGMNLNEGKFTGLGAVYLRSHMIKNPRDPVYVRNPGKELMYACSYQFIDQ